MKWSQHNSLSAHKRQVNIFSYGFYVSMLESECDFIHGTVRKQLCAFIIMWSTLEKTRNEEEIVAKKYDWTNENTIMLHAWRKT